MEEQLFKNSFYFLLESEYLKKDAIERRIKELPRNELEDMAQRAISLALREREARVALQGRINEKFNDTIEMAF
ncbi:MAG TPA: hypothetical protein VK426_01335 [Methanobacterium sp.]|nr:hypothetical protein [Methanobacterium sp.]